MNLFIKIGRWRPTPCQLERINDYVTNYTRTKIHDAIDHYSCSWNYSLM